MGNYPEASNGSQRFPIQLSASVDPDLEGEEETEAEENAAPFPRLPFLILAAASALIAFVGSTYVFTRPCVVGPCQTLQAAQTNEAEVTRKLQTALAKPDILTLQAQLRQTARQLHTIPPWSSHRQAAQTLAQTYQTRAEDLNLVLAAQDQAAIALQRSLNPPHSPAEWAQIQQQWQRAIAQLKQIPSSNSAYPLAQRKIAEYQKNTDVTQKSLVAEQQAAQLLRRARTAAQVAETRQNLAQDLEGWQKAQASWQTAITLLQKIPARSTTAAQVEDLMTTYQGKLVAARNQATQEQVAQSSYNQAQRLAQQAQRLAQRSQWTQAASTWRNALTYLQQVPEETAYADKARTLAATYNTSLEQVQQQLQAVAQLQTAQTELTQTCAGSPQVCTVRVSPGVLRVQLTPAYLQNLLEQTALARRNGDAQTQAIIQQHLTTLQTALESASKNAGLPLEIYDPTGKLMTRYDPSR